MRVRERRRKRSQNRDTGRTIMDLIRYLDLYLSESQENLRALNRALLEMESKGAGAPVEEAFRAAHTLKGMSATMGFSGVMDLSHHLEDRLEEVRSGRRSIDGELVDALLADADRLEQEVAAAVSSESGGAIKAEDAISAVGDGPQVGPASAAPAEGDSTSAETPEDAPEPEGTQMIVRVTLRADEALRGARALLVRARVEEVAEVLGSDPESLGDGSASAFSLFLGVGTSRGAVEDAIAAAGDVERVVFSSPSEATMDGQSGAAAGAHVKRASTDRTSAGTRVRHVRVDQRYLDHLADGIGELGIVWGRVSQLFADGRMEELSALTERTDRLVEELQDAALAVRMVPVSSVFDRFPRVVRDVARSLGKEVDLELVGREIELDRAILDEIGEPLVHLLRNAVDHGIEAPADRKRAGKPERGRLVLRAERERSSVLIRVEDDGLGVAREKVAARARTLGLLGGEGGERAGGGVAGADIPDEELLRLLSHPGFSTAERVTEVSGRGVGMDVVVSGIRALGGVVELVTMPGQGTTISLRLPVTLAVAQALRVRVAGEEYAIPLTHVAEAVELTDGMVTRVRGKEVLRLREEVLPLVRLGAVLQADDGWRDGAAVVTEAGERRRALAVGELVGREQIVVKGFDAAVGTLPIFAGVTLLADGRPALVLDPMSVH